MTVDTGKRREQTRLRTARWRAKQEVAGLGPEALRKLELLRQLNPSVADSIGVCAWCKRIAVLRNRVCCTCG